MEVFNQFNSIDRNENSKMVSFSKLSTNQAVKRPFKDTTNKTNDVQLNESKVKSNERKTNKSPEIDEFHFPNHGNCFCCGNERKIDNEESQIFHRLCNLMTENCRIPEEEKFDVNEVLLNFQPVHDDVDNSGSILNSDFWIKFNENEEEEKNCSILSIPEFTDDSLDFDESW